MKEFDVSYDGRFVGYMTKEETLVFTGWSEEELEKKTDGAISTNRKQGFFVMKSVPPICDEVNGQFKLPKIRNYYSKKWEEMKKLFGK